MLICKLFPSLLQVQLQTNIESALPVMHISELELAHHFPGSCPSLKVRESQIEPFSVRVLFIPADGYLVEKKF